MKVLNHPIDVIAVFDKEGKIKPYKFKYNDKPVIIHRVMKRYLEKLAGNNRIVFVCIQNERDVYKLKYEIDSQKWFLFCE